MKSTKLLATFLLLFVCSAIFSQKVHYKDSYYTIVKSKIFHRGHDVYGNLSVGERDTIYIIAKELYDEKGKLKEQYKNTKKRDRYKLDEGFWKQREMLALGSTALISAPKPEETQLELSASEAKNTQSIEQENIENTSQKGNKKEEIDILSSEKKEQPQQPKKSDEIERKKVEDTNAEKKKTKEKSEKGNLTKVGAALIASTAVIVSKESDEKENQREAEKEEKKTGDQLKNEQAKVEDTNVEKKKTKGKSEKGTLTKGDAALIAAAAVIISKESLSWRDVRQIDRPP